jgi:hypothetical protein
MKRIATSSGTTYFSASVSHSGSSEILTAWELNRTANSKNDAAVYKRNSCLINKMMTLDVSLANRKNLPPGYRTIYIIYICVILMIRCHVSAASLYRYAPDVQYLSAYINNSIIHDLCLQFALICNQTKVPSKDIVWILNLTRKDRTTIWVELHPLFT